MFGIIDLQIYFPSYYVSQTELEDYDKVPKGKYTIGLGQINLAFVDDNEDINSICLTVLETLIKKNNIPLESIGRIEIGTETLIDKSKSIKTSIMDLFKSSTNHNIEGVTTFNACYGGTSALLNAFNWLYSSYYDGRYAIVICGDIAVYAKGNARPTGGAGALAILLGRGGSIVLNNRFTCMGNTYDFYKPDLTSEYPIVDGKFSLNCYLNAVKECAVGYEKTYGNIESDFFCFHCPYSKIVEKGFAQLKLKDKCFLDLTREEQKILVSSLQNEYNIKVLPGLFLCKELGNLYTGSIFGSLLSLILIAGNKTDMYNKTITCFSYGSGFASTLFSLKIIDNSYKRIIFNNSDVIDRLKARIKKAPIEYDKILSQKEKLYLINNYIPSSTPDHLFPNTYFLSKVDEKWKRFYSKKTLANDGRVVYNQLSGTLQSDIWDGFYKKSILERQLQIKKVYPNVEIEKLNGGLNLLRADNMVENCIGVLNIPIGLGLHFKINSKEYTIPMSTEEPSVIAAASNAAKLISQNDGFFCYNDPPYMISQIHYQISPESNIKFSDIVSIIEKNKEKLISYGNSNVCYKMFQRGGGIYDIHTRPLGENYFVIEMLVGVCESMGANLLNQISEEISKYILDLKLFPFKPILRILSNLAVYRKTTSEFKINIKNLSYKGLSGEEVANKIIQGHKIAVLDPFRASTHNKGIMNGISAVALALGQDTRAIEASIHSYAALDPINYTYSKYRPLTYYEIVVIKNEKFLYGNLTVPLPIGTIGGAINSNDSYKNNMKIANNPNSLVLGHIMASVGLAQNFAAMRALVTEGIQKGHIGLHAKNVAFRAGVPDYLIPDVVEFMKNKGTINEDTAIKYMESLNLYKKIRKKEGIIENKQTKLSTFYIDINFDFLKEPICMNFLIQTKISPEINFNLTSSSGRSDERNEIIFKELFGKKKQVEWLYEFMMFVHEMDLFKEKKNERYQIKYKLKFIIILMYVISGNLLKLDFKTVSSFIQSMINEKNNYNELAKMIPSSKKKKNISLEFGMTVLLELYEICNFYLMNYIVVTPEIREQIKREIQKSLNNFILISNFAKDKNNIDEKFFNTFFELRITRLNAEVLILCDLGFDDKKYTKEEISNFLCLGRYASIKITLLRDYHKNKSTNFKHMNTFHIFTHLMNSKGITDEKLIKEKYLKLKSKELEALLERINKISNLPEKGNVLTKKIESKFILYYNFATNKAKL